MNIRIIIFTCCKQVHLSITVAILLSRCPHALPCTHNETHQKWTHLFNKAFTKKLWWKDTSSPPSLSRIEEIMEGLEDMMESKKYMAKRKSSRTEDEYWCWKTTLRDGSPRWPALGDLKLWAQRDSGATSTYCWSRDLRRQTNGKKIRFPYTVHSAAPMATSNIGVGQHQKVELINIVKYRSCSFMFFSRRLGNFMYLNFFYSHETRVACL